MQKLMTGIYLPGKKMLEDSVTNMPLLLTMKKDERTFYVLDRNTTNGVLHFSYDSALQILHDDKTNSAWNINGICIDGIMKGSQLKPVQSYQEFWHSWKEFHPDTEKFE